MLKETQRMLEEYELKKADLMKIILKVHEPGSRDKYKNINGNKTESFKEILKIVRENVGEDFCGDSLKDVKDENIRFRAYLPRFKICETVYQDIEIDGHEKPTNLWNRSLHELGFHSHFEFKIEIREDGGEFPEYDENWLYIRPWTWKMFLNLKGAQDGIDYHAKNDGKGELGDEMALNVYDLEGNPCDMVRIDKEKSTMKDLEQKISDLTGIPLERLILLLRQEGVMSGSDVLCEHFNVDWTREKLL